MSWNVKRRLASCALGLSALALSSLACAALAAAGAPSVATGSARDHTTYVTLTGTVDPHGVPGTTFYFQYGPTPAYQSQTTPIALAPGVSPVPTTKLPVAQNVTGLPAGDYYRLVATNAEGTAYGAGRIYSASSSKGKPVKRKFEISKPGAPLPMGGSTYVTGSITGLGSATAKVVLQASAYPYIEAFKNVGVPQATTPGGRFALRTPSLSKSTRFRVAALEPEVLYSPTVTEQVSVRVTFNVRTTSLGRGIVRLYGTVTPAEVGARVSFEVEKPPKAKTHKPAQSEKAQERAEAAEETARFSPEFSTVVKHATQRTSRFSKVETIKTEGDYRVYVEVPKGALVGGYSRLIFIHAAPKSSKQKG